MTMRSRIAALSVSALALAGIAVPSAASASGPGVFCQNTYTNAGKVRVGECSDGSVRVYRWDTTRGVWTLALTVR